MTETERLAALARLHILDTPPEPAFDDAVELVRLLCGTSMALVSLVDRDRQWFKAAAGIAACGSPRDTSVCSIAIEGEDLLVIPDLTQDPRTREMSLV
ncbi:MAG: sensor domain-containing diguanylate cyclase, partial [Sphingomonas sp.]